MPKRSSYFQAGYEPLKGSTQLSLNTPSPKGVFSFFNPTQATFRSKRSGEGSSSSDSSSGDSPSYRWSSRDNRKGRHTLVLSKDRVPSPLDPDVTSSWKAVRRVLWLMLSTFPVDNISYVIALLYVVGSCFFVVSGFFSFLPNALPLSVFPGESDWMSWISFTGSCIFELGTVLLVTEAVNANKDGCFGWAVEELFGEGDGEGENDESSGQHGEEREGQETDPLIKRDAEQGGSYSIHAEKGCGHHHSKSHQVDSSESGQEESWQWFPSWDEFKTYYLYELGFMAAIILCMGSTTFWVGSIIGLPPIKDKLPSRAAVIGAYWVPEITGGVFFVISTTMYMLETQEKWWKPAIDILGWHISALNVLGSVAFLLCGIFGAVPESKTADYAIGLTMLIGSLAFLVGSGIQLYESLDTHPVEESKEEE